MTLAEIRNQLSDDDAVSIISTTTATSNRRTKTRKTMRKGKVLTKILDSSFDTTSDYMPNRTLNDSINSHNSSSNTIKSDHDQLHGTSLYDEKIDKFVKALLNGDETILDDTSELSDNHHLLNDLNNRKKSRSGGSGDRRNIDIEELPPPPSFIRPSTAPTAGRRMNWHDPVKRHSEYQNYWKTQPRCNQARDHKRNGKREKNLKLTSKVPILNFLSFLC